MRLLPLPTMFSRFARAFLDSSHIQTRWNEYCQPDSGSRMRLEERSRMLRSTFAILLSGLLLGSTLGFQSVGAQTGRDSESTETVRATVQKLGQGREAKVEVKMRDNSKFKGYISAVDEDSFVVTNPKTGSSQTVAYADTMQVKKASSGVSSRTWIIVGAAAAAAVIVGVVLKPALCDGGAQTRGPC